MGDEEEAPPEVVEPTSGSGKFIFPDKSVYGARFHRRCRRHG
jgi:hypothetical protein